MHTCKSHHVDAYLQKPSRQSSFRKLPLCLLADILILRRPSTRLPAGPWKWRWEIFPSANIRVKCVIVTNDWNINLTTLHLLNLSISYVGNDNNEAFQARAAVQCACCIFSSLQRRRTISIILEGPKCPISSSDGDIVIVTNAWNNVKLWAKSVHLCRSRSLLIC